MISAKNENENKNNNKKQQQQKREKYRMRKARYLFTKTRDTKGILHSKMVTIKDRNYGSNRRRLY